MTGIKYIVSTVMKFIQASLKTIQGIGTLTLGIVVLMFAFFVIVGSAPEPAPHVPNGALLVLAPSGDIVEQKDEPDPFATLLADYKDIPVQTSIHDITTALKRAKDDDRIKGLALITHYMGSVGPSHMHAIAAAIRDFKTSGKKVYALSMAYTQAGYMLAAEADTIYMNPQGNVILSGYGSYPMYFRSLLEKIGANVNVFKVGKYKSAVEPFLRDDMSPAAKEANLAFLGSLWDQYTASVEAARGMETGTVKSDIEAIANNLRAAEGSFAGLAKNSGLVDELAPRAVWRKALIEEYGANKSGDSFKQINFQSYLAATDHRSNNDKDIAVITAQGPIVMGSGPINVTAAETVAGYIREARNNDDTAVIVLRINSGGGSAFASEIIRQELVTAQEQGIKVIASMGPVAASGGYWIAATADEIWAAPSTITGSIGIFGMIPTFEKTLDSVGVHSDGVGTSPLAGAFDISRAMSDNTKDIIQQSIESGYREFLSLVARGRGKTTQEVDAIAQGRVWAGVTAKELGLVDHLGSFDDAVNAAAKAAGIEEYNLVFYREQPSEFDQMIAELFNSSLTASVKNTYLKPQSSGGFDPILKKALALKDDLGLLTNLNDPMGRYVVCLTCDVTQ